MRFGEYLLNKGKIEESELEDSLKFQKEKHIILGVLAIRENALNNKQLSVILDHQRESGCLFGEIAIELGFLSKDDMEDELRQFYETAGRKEQISS